MRRLRQGLAGAVLWLRAHRRLTIGAASLVVAVPVLVACTPLKNPDHDLPPSVHRIFYDGGTRFYYCYEPWTGGFPLCPEWV